uniref:Reverse transcriptase domain-containing protein n=1 Tax=Leptobrachium leishanense TaxID=445787 RepID=A0A8C5MN77_9ANUR
MTPTDPGASLEALNQLLSQFSDITGYKINTDKSVILPFHLSGEETAQFTALYGFKVSTTSIPYLGINLTISYVDLYKGNYSPLFAQLRRDLEAWDKDCISCLGRIHCIKMNLLSCLLYLFQALPVPVDPSDLTFLQSNIDAFVWRQGRHRVARNTLYCSRESGGLGLPNLLQYYHAAQLTQIVAAHSPPSSKRWVDFEAALMWPDDIRFRIWLSRRDRPPLVTLCPTILHVFSLWDKLSLKKGLCDVISSLMPLWRNRRFVPGLQPTPFGNLANCALYHIWDMHLGGHLVTFDMLSDRVTLSPRDFFWYLQLCHFITQLEIRQGAEASLTSFECLCLTGSSPKRLISLLYASLMSSKGSVVLSYMTAWKKELGSDIEGDDWEEIWEATRKVSICTTLQ